MHYILQVLLVPFSYPLLCLYLFTVIRGVPLYQLVTCNLFDATLLKMMMTIIKCQCMCMHSNRLSSYRTSSCTAMTFFLSMWTHLKDTPTLINRAKNMDIITTFGWLVIMENLFLFSCNVLLLVNSSGVHIYTSFMQ